MSAARVERARNSGALSFSILMLYVALPYGVAALTGTPEPNLGALAAWHSAAESVYCEEGLTPVTVILMVETLSMIVAALLARRSGDRWGALGVALVSIATPLASATVYDKWFDFPRTFGLMILPAASVAAGIWLWRSLRPEVADWKPFAGAVAIFALAFIGLAYTLFPYVVMDRLTIWDAAAHPSSLKVVLAGAVVVLPFIVAYTAFSYRVFRGKARKGLYE